MIEKLDLKDINIEVKLTCRATKLQYLNVTQFVCYAWIFSLEKVWRIENF